MLYSFLFCIMKQLCMYNHNIILVFNNKWNYILLHMTTLAIIIFQFINTNN